MTIFATFVSDFLGNAFIFISFVSWWKIIFGDSLYLWMKIKRWNNFLFLILILYLLDAVYSTMWARSKRWGDFLVSWLPNWRDWGYALRWCQCQDRRRKNHRENQNQVPFQDNSNQRELSIGEFVWHKVWQMWNDLLFVYSNLSSISVRWVFE